LARFTTLVLSLACLIVSASGGLAVEVKAGDTPAAVPGQATSEDIVLKFGGSTLTLPRSTIVRGLPKTASGTTGVIPIYNIDSRSLPIFVVPSPTRAPIWQNPKWSKCFVGVRLSSDSALDFKGYASTMVDWQNGSRTRVADDIWRMDQDPNDPRMYLSTFFEIDTKVMMHANDSPIRFSCLELQPTGHQGDCRADILVAPDVVAIAMVWPQCLDDSSRMLADLPIIMRDVLHDTLTYLRPRITIAKP